VDYATAWAFWFSTSSCRHLEARQKPNSYAEEITFNNWAEKDHHAPCCTAACVVSADLRGRGEQSGGRDVSQFANRYRPLRDKTRPSGRAATSWAPVTTASRSWTGYASPRHCPDIPLSAAKPRRYISSRGEYFFPSPIAGRRQIRLPDGVPQPSTLLVWASRTGFRSQDANPSWQAGFTSGPASTPQRTHAQLRLNRHPPTTPEGRARAERTLAEQANREQATMAGSGGLWRIKTACNYQAHSPDFLSSHPAALELAGTGGADARSSFTPLATGRTLPSRDHEYRLRWNDVVYTPRGYTSSPTKRSQKWAEDTIRLHRPHRAFTLKADRHRGRRGDMV